MYHVAEERRWVMGRGGGTGGGRGEAQKGGREAQTGDQGLSVISCSKYSWMGRL